MSNEENKLYNTTPSFKVNGRMFPLWLLKNFKKYILPEIVMEEGKDSCNITTEKKKSLRAFQEFATKYLSYYNDLLLYVGTGGGKTITTIAIYNTLYNRNSDWNIFLLVKASLRKDPWEKDIEGWLEKDDYQNRLDNIKYINYDSPYADKTFREVINQSDSSKKNFYIIDEAHNFIRNVYSNKTENKGKGRAIEIYNHIIQDKKTNRDTRVLLLSATPAINKPYELALLFNMLRPDIFKMNEITFEQYFVETKGGIPTIHPQTKNTFQRRIMGLVSYYIGATPDLYAKKNIHFIDVPMDRYQNEVYDFWDEKETKRLAELSRSKQGKRKIKMQKLYTRYAANFTYPNIDNDVSGITRPQASNFKLSTATLQELLKLTDKERNKTTSQNYQKYIAQINIFTQRTDEYFGQKHSLDKKNNYTIKDDMEEFKKYETYEEYSKKTKQQSLLLKELIKCSNKYVNIIFNILKSKGPTLLYTNNVIAEGFDMLRVYLKYFGFGYYTDPDAKDYFKYGEFRNGISKEDREKVTKINNTPENKHGKDIKLLMFSPAGAEGINLKNMRQVHITEPYYNETRIIQMMGRAIRYRSHCDLPVKERIVDVFRYRSLKNPIKVVTIEDRINKTAYKKQVKIEDPDQLLSIDHRVENDARSKDNLITSFLDAVKEVAIDCELYKNHNMFETKYKCFKFNETSYFDQNIGPAYREDIEDDLKYNNGSNSSNSLTVKIRVTKIMGVVENSKDQTSEPYWYDPTPSHNVVYDYELHYPVGRIKKDDKGVPIKLDKDTYIIDAIMIPEISDKK